LIYETLPHIEGLIYPSAMYGGAASIALYDRAENALPRQPELHRPLSDPLLAQAIVDAAGEVGYELI
jgi:hypothetical protein